MCKNKFRKVMSLICAITCILSLSIPCMAADTTSPEDSVIELSMTNINDAQCVLTVKDGKAAARVEVGGKRGSEKCKIVLKIQKQQGTSWITVDSWTVEEDGRNASIEESVKAESGKTYRAQATVTVWLDGKSESKTITGPRLYELNTHAEFAHYIVGLNAGVSFPAGISISFSGSKDIIGVKNLRLKP